MAFQKWSIKNLWPRKLMFQLALYISLLLSLSMAVYTWHTTQDQINKITKNMQLQAEVLAKNIAAVSAEHILTRDYSALELLLLRTIEFPGIDKVQVSDKKGKLLGDITQQKKGEPIIKYGQPTLVLPNKNKSFHMLNENIMVVWQPIILGELIGWVKITSSLEPVVLLKKEIINKYILEGFFLLLIILVLLVFYVRKSISAIERYTDFADKLDIIKGTEVLVSKSSVELEHLGVALNKASKSLHDESLVLTSTLMEMERLAQFPEMNPNIVLSMDLKAEVLYLNPYGLEFIRSLNILQTHMTMLLPENIKEIITNCIEKNETMHAVESKYKNRTFLWTFSPVVNQELVHGYALEVTQRKEALAQAHEAKLEKMAAEAANVAKSTFLANMSHEIRTPLTAIIGFSESLLDTTQSMPERVQSINTVIRSGKHLMQIINDILDLSKVEADKMEIEQLNVSLFDLFADIKSLITLLSEEKGITFDVEYKFPVPDIITTDPVRLKQIIINLCNNAVKFTQKGGVKVKVSFNSSENLLNVDVIDSGVGLTSEQISKIFNPFTQADTSTTRQYGGTGLGLHLSQRLANKLGGKISVESTPDVGSCFSLTVATGDIDKDNLFDFLPENKSISTQSPIADESEIKVNGKVLLAEDNVDNQRLVSMYLNKLGADVVVANNGKEAIEQTVKDDFDLILMDMQMPVMNGMDAIIRLREMGYTKPIVALTANAMKEDVDAYYKAGCDGFIQKPISQHKFKACVTQYLESSIEEVEDSPIASTLLIDEPEMTDLVHRFVNQLPSYVENISKSEKDKNWEQLRDHVHSLKGTSGNFGFDDLYKLMLNIEFELTKENYTGIHSQIKKLDNLCQRIQLGIK